ncbi:MAG: hypothetical protein LBV12_00775 [Puniceicoccales bacterium]|nr:hypothetical protein [Puniceicoccales bacterium]
MWPGRGASSIRCSFCDQPQTGGFFPRFPVWLPQTLLPRLRGHG